LSVASNRINFSPATTAANSTAAAAAAAASPRYLPHFLIHQRHRTALCLYSLKLVSQVCFTFD
jgi:hypothetical protein